MNKTRDSDVASGSQVVYVVRQDSPEVDDGLNLAAVLGAVRSHRWWAAGLTALGTLIAVAYALSVQPLYRAESILYPRELRAAGGLSAQLSQLGGLADLAGIGGGGGSKQEPLGVLRSKGFASRFIAEQQLAQLIVPEAQDNDPRKATEIFARSVLSVFEDKRTGLVTVGVKWRDPEIAADWANAIVGQLNEEMRARALQESEENIRYLRGQLENTHTVALQESISRLLEAEMQKNMLARGTSEYSFRVLDAAEPPVRPVWPKRSLIVAMGFSFSVFASVILLAIAGPLRRLWVRSRVA
jgi:uncharacterized protein involved in exopolysaccharide biosynthesis